MVRGKTWFRCSCCGHIFKTWDIEDNATVYSVPMTCPKCGGKGYSVFMPGIIQMISDKIAERRSDRKTGK